MFAFLMSMFDKLVAKKILPFRTFRRVPENAFYLVSFLGGSPGLFISFEILRHKTSYRKQRFRRNVIFCAILAVAMKRFGLVM